jgi:hypothetical protein
MSEDVDVARLRTALHEEARRPDPGTSTAALVSRVVDRGRRVRRRRRAASVLVAGVVVTTSALALPRVLDADPRTGERAQDGSAVAPTTRTPTRRTVEDCRAPEPAGVDASAAERDLFATRPEARFDLTGPDGAYDVLVFREGPTFGTCTLPGPGIQADRGPLLTFQPALRRPGTHVASAGTSGGSATDDDGTTQVTSATGTVDATVSAVRITIGTTTYDAAVDHGVYAALVSFDHDAAETRAGTVSAYDAQGQLLEQVPLAP